MGLFKDCGCGCGGKKKDKELAISAMSALLFYIVANPQTFKVVRRFAGGWVSSPTGCPTGKGLMLHALVFLLITWGLMNVNIKELNVGVATPMDVDVDVDADTDADAGADASMNAIMGVPGDTPVDDQPRGKSVNVCQCDDGTEILHLM